MRPVSLRVPVRTVVRVMLTVAAGLTAAAFLEADIPSAADGTITACYRKTSPTLRVIDAEAGQTCMTGETALTWNQTGVEGPIGPVGPQGEQGPPGNMATSDVFFASFHTDLNRGEQGVLLGSQGVLTPVLTLQVPAGAYLVEARMDLHFGTTREGSTQAHCFLPGDAGTSARLDSSERPGILQSSSNAQREITTAINHAGGALTLTCWAGSLSGVGTTVSNASLLATPVGAVHR